MTYPPLECGLGRIVDMSADGLCIRLQKPIRVRPGDSLSFRVGKAITESQVIWYRPGLFKREIGVHFENKTSELDREMRRAVSEVLNMGVMHGHVLPGAA